MPSPREFQGGQASFREKLNEIVRGVRALLQIRGDEQFIVVRSTVAGFTISLNIDAVRSRVLRAGGTDIPQPTAANQVLVSKPDPDNPGKFIWEANWSRWHS